MGEHEPLQCIGDFGCWDAGMLGCWACSRLVGCDEPCCVWVMVCWWLHRRLTVTVR